MTMPLPSFTERVKILDGGVLGIHEPEADMEGVTKFGGGLGKVAGAGNLTSNG
jgi:hypothetical protein